MGIALLVHHMLFICTGDPVSYFQHKWTGHDQMLLTHYGYYNRVFAGQKFEAKAERLLRVP